MNNFIAIEKHLSTRIIYFFGDKSFSINADYVYLNTLFGSLDNYLKSWKRDARRRDVRKSKVYHVKPKVEHP